ncbi:Prestin [Schistosoma japonicum]|uniref:Prestin n=2 Tax=Schistosoma japonicum TaxID=6182 RepID=A0A4Z2DT47_SCHJA|nr:Prestin [Schistosoma japonicum]
MSSYDTVDNEIIYYQSHFNTSDKSNLNGTVLNDSKFVTNVHLGRIAFNRPIADWDSLMSKQHDEDSTSKKRRNYCLKSILCCSKKQWRSYSIYIIKSVFPCIETLLHYNWRADFLKDISGGLTIGNNYYEVPHQQQSKKQEDPNIWVILMSNYITVSTNSLGMAYSLLAGLPPVYGLYIGFLSPLLYAIFGRCTQFSMGTFAVISLLIVGPIEQHSSKIALNYPNPIINSNSTLSEHVMTDGLPLHLEPRAIVAVTLTFLVGIVQLTIGFCRLGTFTSYLAPSMVSGYTSGSGYHVLSSQVSSLFGVKSAKKYQGPGSFFMVYVNLFKHIRDTNLFTLLISTVSIAFLMIIKFCVEPLLKRHVKFNFPIPSELILVALGTVASATLNLHSTKNVSIVGYIASGMPQITVPYWSIVPDLLPDAILIGFVSTFLSISLVKLFSLKYRNKVNFNHEILSFGIINTFTSFFSCFVQSGSLSRSMVLAGTRTRTPLSGIFSSILIVFVLLFLGPYFEATPSCILSAIIVVALKNILAQPKKLPYLWRTYKPDFFLFTVTFLGTVILDATYGLLVGLISCLIVLTERQRSVKLLELRNISGTELYVHKHYELLTNTQIDKTQSDYLLSSIRAIRVLGSLNFSSAENFTNRIYKTIDNMIISEYEEFNGDNHLSNHNEVTNEILLNITNKPLDDDAVNKTDNVYHNHCQLNGKPAHTYVNIHELSEMLDKKNVSKISENYLMTTGDVDKSDDYPTESRQTSMIARNDLSYHHTQNDLHLSSNGLNNSAIEHSGEQLRRFLLLDISGITHIDPAGASALSEIQRNLFRKKHYMILCGDPAPFKCLSIDDWYICPGLKPIYPTLYDAGAVCVKLLCQGGSNPRSNLEQGITDRNVK